MKHFEKNYRFGKWGFRLGWHQVALWLDYEPLIDWLTPWSDRLYTFRRGLYIGRMAIITYGKDSTDLARERVSLDGGKS